MTIIYPIRINKYLAEKKYATRVGADELISQGLVFVNGRKAVLGEMIKEADVVEVREGKEAKARIYLAYNKPRGVVTHSADEGDEDIKDRVRVPSVFPIGRLDKDSSGLIILTNDGRVTERLLSPAYDHEKEYLVTTKDALRGNFREKMSQGVHLGTEVTRPAHVEVLDEHTFTIVLTEGKNRQIRRMCAALFQEVVTLCRTRIMNIELGDLKEDAWRAIEGEELATFLTSLELR